MSKSKPDILAVHQRKLEAFLAELGVLDQLRKGNLRCAVCEKTLALENIGLIIPVGKEIVFCCTDTTCVLSIKKKGSQENE